MYIQDIYVQIYLKNDVSAIPDKTDLSILKTSYCYQLASESLVKVIAVSLVANLQCFWGSDCVEARYACEKQVQNSSVT